MPLGHHKKPFSNKQKKVQLQQKREIKRQNQWQAEDQESPETTVRAAKEFYGRNPAMLDSASENGNSDLQMINQQPNSSSNNNKKACVPFDSNRYRLWFHKESKADIEERKLLARQPIRLLNEEELEIDAESVYLPGTVLDMPKRPKWDYSMSKEKLEIQENRYYRDYVAAIESDFQLKDLSYFELNLETWRQLWRVLEMSDIVFIVVDIRFPALLFSPALYTHITEELKKTAILIVNKVDLAPPSLLVAWKRYFLNRFPQLHVLYFTSFPGNEVKNDVLEMKRKRRLRRHQMAAEGALKVFQICETLVSGKVDLKDWRDKIMLEMNEAQAVCDYDDEKVDAPVTIADLDTSYSEYVRYKDNILTIGFIGQPNVGKSSLINALMGKKVVSVSKTPGHTKHFQTIFLTNNVRLCDCPGLVFPSKVPKPLQVLTGTFPIAQLKEPYSSVRYLGERLCLPKMLRLQHPDPDESEWSAIDICDAWAEKRGFKTARAARNDTYRAANHILRLALEGRICLCLRPPGYTKDKQKWESDPEVEEVLKVIALKQDLETDAMGNNEADLMMDESESDNGDEMADGTNPVVGSSSHRHFGSLNKFAVLQTE